MAVLRYFHKAPKTTTSTTVVDNTAVQTIAAALDTKADKVVGKGFSQNNYSTIEKTKLRGIEEGAEVNVQSDWNEIDPESDAFILNKPDIPILDLSGQIPARYLPSYVDDVLEYSSTSAFPNPGETGKIYVDTSTDLTYRWSGSTYVEISKSILTGVKGDAESTYRVGNVNLTATNIGLGNVANIDLSKAIKSITRNGTTFTYTCLDGTTGTFTLQDNNTTYSAGTGLSLSGTTFSLALTKALVTTALGYTPPTSDTNTWRTVLCNGTSIGSNTLNLKAGTNVTLSNSNGTITINSTDTNTWRPLGTGASDACAGNDSRLSNSRPASDVYSWAKASTKPSYNHSEISAGNLTVGSGNYYLNMRSGHNSYNGGIYYSTPGNEALVFANKADVTSWIFATGDVTSQTDWRNVTSNVQIKKLSLYINKALGDGVDPSYNLYVNGPAVSKYMKFLNLNKNDFSGYIGAGSTSFDYIFIEAYGHNSIMFKTDSTLRCLIDDDGKWWFANHTCLYGGGELNIRGSESGGTLSLGYCCSMNGSNYWYIPVDGKAKFVSVSQSSDLRKKDVVSDTSIDINTIAQAPLFKFLWKDKTIDDFVHIGTSAQYWKEKTPELISENDDEDKTLSIEYSTLGVATSISIAKEVVKMQNKIDTLEQRILQLENLLSKLIK